MGNESFNKALCDVGASINLMPLSISKRLDIVELKPMIVTLQLVDASIKHLSRGLENVLIQVGKLYVLVDFIVLEMEEDAHIPVIFKRPIFAIVKAMIDVKKGMLTFEIGQKKVKFNMFKLTKQPFTVKSYCKVDTTDKCIKKVFNEKFLDNALESCLIHKKFIEHKNLWT